MKEVVPKSFSVTFIQSHWVSHQSRSAARVVVGVGGGVDFLPSLDLPLPVGWFGVLGVDGMPFLEA